MTFEPIESVLKDGRKLTIRSPRTEDAREMLDFLRAAAGETDFILRYPEECDAISVEMEEQFFGRLNASGNDAMLVALVDGRIAGNCRLMMNSGMKTRHRANVAIALRREYWNLGIGTRLFEEMIRIAEECEGLMQMELDFIEGNERARHLYEKMGFRIVGVMPNAIRLKDGRLLNEYRMVRIMK